MAEKNRERALRLRDKRSGISKRNDGGFTLLETSIALVILMFVALGAASLFAYSINYNSASNDRAQSLAIAQLRMEKIRNTDFSALGGGTTTQYFDSTGTSYTTNALCQTGLAAQSGMRCYAVVTIIDDNPATAAVDVDATKTLKGIIVKVTPQGARAQWATAASGTDTIDTVRIMTQRAKSF